MLTLSVATMVVMAGCAQPGGGVPSGPIFDRQPTEGLRAAPATRALELMPLRRRAGVRRYTRGDQQPVDVRFTLEPKDETDTWVMAIENRHVAHYRVSADQTIELVEEEDLGENVRVRYQPALVRLPAAVEMGPIAEQADVEMTVLNLADGALRDQGVTSNVVEVIGMQTLTTPAGKFDAVIVRTTRSIDLRLADVSILIHSAYAPDVGLVAESIDRTTRVVGLFTSVVREEWRLVE